MANIINDVPGTDVAPITQEVNVVHGEIDVKNGTVTYHPVKTNADRIRAMSDEELAKFIEWSDCPPHDGVCDRDNITCSKCWLDWLQSPVGGEENED